MATPDAINNPAVAIMEIKNPLLILPVNAAHRGEVITAILLKRFMGGLGAWVEIFIYSHLNITVRRLTGIKKCLFFGCAEKQKITLSSMLLKKRFAKASFVTISACAHKRYNKANQTGSLPS
ncbi:MAG: hypothetical protein ACJ751_28160 [Niastella sp.]|uniref:hypothetical protein n=1 Tax=Niastella sp. TaxID=1869183 RepID=UPI00389AA70B